eukprot:TRINITY_DN6061_c0_g1_i1.p1 TRINITY_DN6061_c0_g1~~TRINITY_DN6061_c0_g1_i1.p1  ORF type:complete len:476 (+),score=97.24 TRINITY_DN6061_c0_g1_i1:50-1429(+)
MTVLKRSGDPIEELAAACRRIRLDPPGDASSDSDKTPVYWRPVGAPTPPSGEKRRGDGQEGQRRKVRRVEESPLQVFPGVAPPLVTPACVLSAVAHMPATHAVAALVWIVRLCASALEVGSSCRHRPLPHADAERCAALTLRVGLSVHDSCAFIPLSWEMIEIDALFRSARAVGLQLSGDLMPAAAAGAVADVEHLPSTAVSCARSEHETAPLSPSPRHRLPAAVLPQVDVKPGPRVRAAAASLQQMSKRRQVSVVTINCATTAVAVSHSGRMAQRILCVLADAVLAVDALVLHSVFLRTALDLEQRAKDFCMHFCGGPHELGTAIMVRKATFPRAKRYCNEQLTGGGRLVGVDLGPGIAAICAADLPSPAAAEEIAGQLRCACILSVTGCRDGLADVLGLASTAADLAAVRATIDTGVHLLHRALVDDGLRQSAAVTCVPLSRQTPLALHGRYVTGPG